MSSEKKNIKNIGLLEKNLGYAFKNKEYLINALIHSSYMNEHNTKYGSNERLEFLGDSVLSLITAEYLYEHINKDEGHLTKLKAVAVCESALFEYAKALSLGEFLLFGKGEKEEGKNRASTLADAFEAVLGAIYLDAGIDSSREFVLPFVTEVITRNHAIKDYKTILQEVIQKNKGEKLSYNIVDESGPAHDRVFVCEVLLNTNIIGRGEGRSKKSAEQGAAKQALSLLGIEV